MYHWFCLVTTASTWINSHPPENNLDHPNKINILELPCQKQQIYAACASSACLQAVRSVNGVLSCFVTDESTTERATYLSVWGVALKSCKHISDDTKQQTWEAVKNSWTLSMFRRPNSVYQHWKIANHSVYARFFFKKNHSCKGVVILTKKKTSVGPKI